MRVLPRLLIIVFGMYFGIASSAQSAPKQTPEQEQGLFWTILVDPVCPVSPIYGSPNGTSDVRVMYFPGAKDAKLKDSKSLSLQIAFDGPHFGNNRAIVPFTRKGDHWETLVPLEKSRPLYAIFYVKDVDTGATDDNAGKYWDVVFCSPEGDREPNGLLEQAESYSGESWPLGIRRQTDYAKAIALLDNAVANSGFQKALVLPKMWDYKAKLDGDTPEAYSKVAAEVELYLTEHSEDPGVRYGVSNFIINFDKKLPADFVDRMAAKLDEKNPDSKFGFRAQLAFGRAQREPDPHKRLAALGHVIAEYPNADASRLAYSSRLQTCVALKDVACAEATLPKFREASRAEATQGLTLQGQYLQVADLYAEKGVELDTALKLTDEQESSLEPMRRMDADEGVSWLVSQIAETRARIYLGTHKYNLALAEAQKAMTTLEKRADAHRILAEAYAGTGQNAKALEEYFNAALMPSNQDLEYRAELQSFYLAHFGNQKQFETALHKQIADRFQAANYVPKLLDQPAPQFEFTTLKGEKFDAANLNGKIVVINFWSPG
jgi:hypothetical protein